MNCLFCDEITVNKHLCFKLYSYEYIFKQFFINILLDFKPRNSTEFYNCSKKRIKQLNMFKEVPNPYNIMIHYMEIFFQEYECF